MCNELPKDVGSAKTDTAAAFAAAEDDDDDDGKIGGISDPLSFELSIFKVRLQKKKKACSFNEKRNGWIKSSSYMRY